MNERTDKGNILVYGEEGASPVLECMLKGCGYGVVRINSGEKLMECFCLEDTALLLYDFQTEAGNGEGALGFLTELRRSCNKPIVVLADRDKEMLRILALNAGADDVLDSECSPMESMARIQAQIRCYLRLSSGKEQHSLMKMDDLEVDDRAKLVLVKGNRVDLTPTEYKILHLLMEKPGRVLSNKQIYESIWKMEPIGADNTVAVHIRHIREKIEENPQEPRYLQVVWGQGYKVG